MRVIGGVISWDEPAPTLHAVAGTVAGGSGELCGFADLDLTNAEELRALAGVTHDGFALIASLYELAGPRFVRRLRGAFAVAVWDPRQRTLLLAVDHFGMRRLYYSNDGRRVVFASRASATAAAGGIVGQVDLTAVFDYLNFGYVPAPRSIYAGVHRLPPGHQLTIRDGQSTLEPYWDVAYSEQPANRTEAAATLYGLTTEAVRRALAGTPAKEVGAFLSGGTDSSTVVGLMSQVSDRVNAFSIGFREERYNELHYAEAAARHFGISHYTRMVTAEDTIACLPRLVEAFDEPFGNNSAIGTFFGAQLARECGITTLLAGDGGDEIFGGNERYRTDRIFARYHRIPAVLRRRAIEPLLATVGDGRNGLLGRAQRYVRRANLPNPRRFYSYEFFIAQEAERLLAPDFLEAVDATDPDAVIQAHYDRPVTGAELNRLLYLDLKLTIGDNDLLKVVRTAELADIGVRFPLLDLSLVDFTSGLPENFKVRGLEKRYLFKRAFRTLLAPETLAKPKHGFGVPTSTWLKSHPELRALARDILLAPRARQRGYLRAGVIDQLFDWVARDVTPYFGDILWTVLMLELWHRRYDCEAVRA